MSGRRRRLGLRARVTVTYALGALLLSSMVAVGAFTITRARLVSEAEQAAATQAFRNAMDLRQRLNAIPAGRLDPSQADTLDADQALRAPAESTASTDLDPASAGEPTAEIPATTEATQATETTEAIDAQPPVDVDEVLGELTGDDSDTTASSTAAAPSVESEPDQTDADPATTEQPSTTDGPAASEETPTPVADAVTILLESVVTGSETREVLVFRGQDRSLTGAREREMPLDLRQAVRAGTPARQRYLTDGVPQLAVGTPIEGEDAFYYEITSLAELDDNLASLQRILAGTALAASVAGAALGFYSARRALQPLTDVSAAAESIANGRFDTRLDGHLDPDLAGLTSSFNDMVDALQARMERDGRFASDVSHELRSPLMTLAASVGVLQGRRSELPISAQKAVDGLSHDVRRFEGLVEDLLEISRIDVGASDLDLAPVFLREFLTFVVAQSRAPETPLDYRPQEANLVITADKRRLAQAVTNLVDNAVKYADGPTVVGFRTVRDRVTIYVEDGGPGVRSEDRERIFDRFTRAGTDAGRRSEVGGVGLGLSLVSEHIRLHEGTVTVTDRPDGRNGARFVIDIPIGERIEFDEEMAS